MSSNKYAWWLLLCACAGRHKLDVPAYLLRNPTTAPPPAYSVRLSEGDRAWQVALPAGDYDVRVPLAARPEVSAGGEAHKPALSNDSPEFRAELDRVQGMYQKKQYNDALAALQRMRGDFPEDVKLLAMEGTLEWKLGHKQKAQAAWEHVMDLDPGNTTVLQMLEGLQ